MERFKPERNVLMLEEFGGKNGRGSPGQVQEDCWARIFALFREYNLQRLQSKQEDLTEGEKIKRQERMKTMKDMTKKIRSKGRMDAESRWWGLLSCWRQTARMGRHYAEIV